MNNKNKIDLDQLISTLSKKPTAKVINFRPLPMTLIIASLTLLLTVIIFHTHNTIELKNFGTIQIFTMISMVLFVLTGTYATHLSLIPSAKFTPPLIASLFFLVCFLALMGIDNFSNELSLIHRKYCEIEAMSISLISTTFLHFYFKRFELAKLQGIPYLIFFIVPTMASFVLHLSCSVELVHVISCHLAPIIPIPLIYCLTTFYKTK